MKELYMNSDRYRGRVLVTGMNGLLGTNTAHALAAAGYEVRGLDRVYFAGLTKKGLKRGQWRFLTQGEENILKMGAYN